MTPEAEGRGRSDTRLVPDAVLGMAIFLLTEVMLFAGLVAAYIVLRGQTTTWPPVGQPRLPVAVTAANSIVLLASGLTTWRALMTARARGPRVALKALYFATTLGWLFLLVQGYEWAGLIDFGLSTSFGVYAGTFYSTVGIHALHVVAGVVTLLWAERAVRKSKLTVEGLTAVAMFWGFVVLVWPILYVVVYLW